MNVSGAAIGANTSGYPVAKQTNKADSDKKVKDLESKKQRLEQQMQAAKNPFSTQPSKEYQMLSSQVKQVDQQIQQEKSKQDDSVASKGASSANAANNAGGMKETAQNEQVESNAVMSAQGDMYIPSENKVSDPTKGIYSLNRNENGQAMLSVSSAN